MGGARPPVGHANGNLREPAPYGGTLVTSYCDWSRIDPVWRERDIFPLISEQALKATLGILARTVLATEKSGSGA